MTHSVHFGLSQCKSTSLSVQDSRHVSAVMKPTLLAQQCTYDAPVVHRGKMSIPTVAAKESRKMSGRASG